MVLMLKAVLMLLVCGYSFISLDSGCSSKVTTGNIVRLFVEDKVDAFIGPPCSSGLPPQLLTAFITYEGRVQKYTTTRNVGQCPT